MMVGVRPPRESKGDELEFDVDKVLVACISEEDVKTRENSDVFRFKKLECSICVLVFELFQFVLINDFQALGVEAADRA